ncbi:fatty acid desaturase family protein [Hymenobacter jeollabukensis]|uniref:Acyl-CoA desaturase n=1 Tax=Hymenobacter jeollabukensis TaxID=2025313 RepID=A0A5R8WL98_9BACT|nr:acyl-CoA desaturase [Hymenobacter jeollabukensis]TLM90003.1 acyl-CoA desaturase [Hymenobacter jeollabukensis]
MSVPKFAAVRQKESFHYELKRRVNEYFEQAGKAPTGNATLFTKAALLTGALLFLYVHLVFFTPPTAWAILECVLMGGVGAAIGFNVMHDGSHGSFSKHEWLNQTAAFTLNVFGGNSFMWNMKHNLIHHMYTNIDGVDDDIDAQPWLRLSETQPRRALHRYQHLYFWFLYALFYLAWVVMMDYQKYFKGAIGSVPLKKMTWRDQLTFWGFKVLYLALFVALPIYTVGFVSWVVGFLIFAAVAGFSLSLVFQLAHTVEPATFPVLNKETYSMEDEWAVHQLKTTANFATNNKLVTWLLGGLNFQVEHHLFPKISHVHYPAINKIIKQACAEFDVVYNEFPRMRSAVLSHVLFLRQLGRAA